MKALEDASTFDFVGGGATNIAKHQLTGAHIDLKLLFEAVEKGIRQYPVPGWMTFISILKNVKRHDF